jgi:hypothetical protein
MLAGLLIVVFGAAWLIGGLGVTHLSVEAVLALGLMLLGASLVVTARTDWSLSRHAWPVVLGVGLVLVLFATSSTFGATGALSHVSFGEIHRSATKSTTVYGGFGQLDVDARGVPPGSDLHVQSIAGETFIQLPAGKTVDIKARVLAGQVCINGVAANSGIGASTSQTIQGTGRPVTIDVHQVAGQVSIGSKGCTRS